MICISQESFYAGTPYISILRDERFRGRQTCQQASLCVHSDVSAGLPKTMEAEMRKKQEEYSRRTTMMAYVESWLHVLNERERYVVKTQWLGGSTWRELISGFQEQFGDIYSLQGLRKIRNRAFKKICEIAK